jgi:hypothetical protein
MKRLLIASLIFFTFNPTNDLKGQCNKERLREDLKNIFLHPQYCPVLWQELLKCEAGEGEENPGSPTMFLANTENGDRLMWKSESILAFNPDNIETFIQRLEAIKSA